MGSLVQAHPEAPGRKTPSVFLPFFIPSTASHSNAAPLPLTRHPPRRATAMPPPPPLFPHIVGSRHGATEPPMRTAPSRRAERAACRRYAIMVTPTQSVPEVLAVWGSDYKKAIVCRRYTIMVAQIHHLKPRHKTPPKNPTKKPRQKSLSTTLPLSRTSGTLLCGVGIRYPTQPVPPAPPVWG